MFSSSLLVTRRVCVVRTHVTLLYTTDLRPLNTLQIQLKSVQDISGLAFLLNWLYRRRCGDFPAYFLFLSRFNEAVSITVECHNYRNNQKPIVSRAPQTAASVIFRAISTPLHLKRFTLIFDTNNLTDAQHRSAS